MELKILEQVKRKAEPLTSVVALDEFTEIAQNCFDFTFDGVNKFYPYEKPTKIPTEFKIGLIVGSSGSGKSTLLQEFGEHEEPIWEKNKAVISHFNSSDEAINRLNSVGLNSVPSWTKPFDVLSTGEKFRANLARQLKDGAVIDEFTSVVDRNVAKSCCVSINKYITRSNLKNIVFCTCHNDIVEWLCPDWIFDTDTGTLYDGGCLRRPKIKLSLYETKHTSWELFKRHHYLTEKINVASKCFLVKWNDEIVAFASIMSSPNGYVKNSWRFHRLVVLPDYQGMGIGTAVMNMISEMSIQQGLRMFMKTAHARLGYYMENSDLWISTTHNKQKRTLSEKRRIRESWHHYKLDTTRKCFTYEYVGEHYTSKKHYRLAIKFDNEITYEDFVNRIEEILNEHKDEFVIFINGEVGKTNHADIYGKANCIRREHFSKTSKYDELIVF